MVLDSDDERLPDPMLIGVDEELDDTEPEIVVSAPTTQLQADTPMHRVTINMMEIDELDNMLAQLRARRLARVEQAAQLAQARRFAEDELEMAKFDRLMKRITAKLAKCEEDEAKLVDELNKLRIMAVALGG